MSPAATPADRRFPRTTVVMTLFALLLATFGCGPDLGDPGRDMSTVTVTAPGGDAEFSFDTKTEEFSAEPVRLTLTNHGREDHQLTMLELNGDVSLTQFRSRAAPHCSRPYLPPADCSGARMPSHPTQRRQ